MVNVDFDGTAVSYLPHNIIEELATFETIWALLEMQIAAGMIDCPSGKMYDFAQYIYDKARRLFVYTIYCGQSLRFMRQLQTEGISDHKLSVFHRFGSGCISEKLMAHLSGRVLHFRKIPWAPILDFSTPVGQRIPFVTNIPFVCDPVLERTSAEGGYREYRVKFHASHITGVPWYDPIRWYMMRVYKHEYYELEDVAKTHIQGCFFYEEKVYWVYIRENKTVNEKTVPEGNNTGKKNDENPSMGPFMGPVSRA